MGSGILSRVLRSARKYGWSASQFNGSNSSLRLSNGRDEIIIHFAADGRMKSAFRNGARINGGGLRRIDEMLEEGR